MSEKVSRNAEGYPDPTFGGAWGNMRREEKQREAERMAKINDLIPVMKQTAEGRRVWCGEASGAWREPERSSS